MKMDLLRLSTSAPVLLCSDTPREESETVLYHPLPPFEPSSQEPPPPPPRCLAAQKDSGERERRTRPRGRRWGSHCRFCGWGGRRWTSRSFVELGASPRRTLCPEFLGINIRICFALKETTRRVSRGAKRR